MIDVYEEAKKKMYDKGWADGKADFRNGEEYALTKEACLDSGYEKGYIVGHEDGYNLGMKNSVNPSTLFAILFSIFGLVIVLLLTTYFMNKKKKRK